MRLCNAEKGKDWHTNAKCLADNVRSFCYGFSYEAHTKIRHKIQFLINQRRLQCEEKDKVRQILITFVDLVAAITERCSRELTAIVVSSIFVFVENSSFGLIPCSKMSKISLPNSGSAD